MSEHASNDSQSSGTADKSSTTKDSTTQKDDQTFLRVPHGADVLRFLLAFRLLNVLVVQTFFQPDEYFQSLEPAWQLAFGESSGAWITWEWRNHLRSAIHPAIFAVTYRLANALATWLRLDSRTRAEVIMAGPKLLQALIAALGDHYTWKLARYTFGKNSAEPWAVLALTVVSPWQWFCSVRTLSNCLETTLTIVALYNWPWHWSSASDGNSHLQNKSKDFRVREADTSQEGEIDELTRLRRSLMFAAFATILRPTNVLIWIILTFMTFIKYSKSHWFKDIPSIGRPMLIELSYFSFIPNRVECIAFLREGIMCGSIVLLLSAVIDRLFYGVWTFPPYNFLYFNVVQSLAVFYGNNDWHYYLSQGYPLLLTTALPFTVFSIYQTMIRALPAQRTSISRNIISSLTIICLLVPLTLSVISHKEVRFIYPLLPALHILTAPALVSFFGPALWFSITKSQIKKSSRVSKQLLLGFLLGLNLTIALYTTMTHNSGIIALTHYLRHQYETYHLNTPPPNKMTVGMLMPCHSTPWRSHLQSPPTLNQTGIDAWALTCEPPLHLSPLEKTNYQDEADIFYANPTKWLQRNMVRETPMQKKSTPSAQRSHNIPQMSIISERREWPDYLTFFEQLEPAMTYLLQGSGYSECARFFNSHWHDDWRRQGDVVVWCLYPTRASSYSVKNKIDDSLHDPRSKKKPVVVVENASLASDLSSVRDHRSVSTSTTRTSTSTSSTKKTVPKQSPKVSGNTKPSWNPFVNRSTKQNQKEVSSWWDSMSDSVRSITGTRKGKRWWEGGHWT